MTVLVARTGNAFVAPVGTALPTAVTSTLETPWKNLGKLNSSGITVTPSINSSTSNFWQDNEEFTISNGSKWDLGFEMNDWKLDTISIYFNPETVDTTAGSFVVGNNEEAIMALFINFISGSQIKGIGVPQFQITEKSALNLVSTDKLALPVTGTAKKDDTLGGYFKVYDPELVA